VKQDEKEDRKDNLRVELENTKKSIEKRNESVQEEN